MKSFLDDSFLLQTKTAFELYHKYAKDLPIIDYHCHISAKEIAEDKAFSTITEVWLSGDHYKWRLMRAAGVEEKYITGDASDYEKFYAFAGVLQEAIGNPMYHWSHLELQRYFGIKEPLTTKNAKEVYEKCNALLQKTTFHARGLMLLSNVELICTTDDPVDDLHYHKQLREDSSFPIRVLPAFRPDEALLLSKSSFCDYIARLSAVAEIKIDCVSALKEALKSRVAYFHEAGCRLADHGLNYVPFRLADASQNEATLSKALKREPISVEELEAFQTDILLYLNRLYTEFGWTSQLHYGCRRDNNTYMYASLGPNTGFDCIDKPVDHSLVVRFLDKSNSEGSLPKTILYSLNPIDNATIDTIIGCFQDSTARGKIQHGAAWWFNDHLPGMEEHIRSLSAGGLLSTWVGMLTDSRSFVSYTRHEYFRRILCNFIGALVENGEFPADEDTLKKLVQGICHDNAKNYFCF